MAQNRRHEDRDGWWMNAKYDGRCADCGERIEEGDRMGWIPSERRALCPQCAYVHIGDDQEA